MKHRPQNPRNGSALLMAVVLVMVLSIGAAAVWHYLHVTLRETARQEKLTMALHLAEAGLDKAVAELRARPGYAGEQRTPLGRGRFSVTVTQAGPDHFCLTSTGEVAEDRRVQGAVVLAAELTLGPDRTVKRYHWRKEHEKR